MLKATLVFMMQMFLIFLVVLENPIIANIFVGDHLVNSARIICGLILHMSIMPEVRCALELMNFAQTYPKAFKENGNVMPFMLGLCKMFGGLFTEIANVLIIIQSNSIIDVVKDFIALEIIC